MKPEKCSCDESAHLRAALDIIRLICTGDTVREPIADLAQCANVATQGLLLEELEGDPSLYNLVRLLPRLREEDEGMPEPQP